MGMTHSSSGKCGYGLHYRYTSFEFDVPTLQKVLEKENELRFSEEIQAEYSKNLRGNEYLSHIRDVTESVQLRALRESGIKECSLSQALIALQNYRHDFSSHPDLINLSVYGRYDICWKGEQMTGCKLGNFKLHRLDGSEVNLHSLLSCLSPNEPKLNTPLKPALIIASSLS